MRRDQGDDHQGPQAHARHRGGARRGRAGGSGRRRLSEVARIFDRAAATYDRAVFPFFTPFAEALVERAALERDERVLDVGCGTGAALAAAGEITGDVTGVDISPAMVERAREAVPGADLVVGDVAALPFEDATFDVVVSAFVVFFLDDPPAGLREWRRVLRPGGRIAMSTWNGPDERWSWERALRQEFAGEMPPELLPRIATQLERLARFDEPGKVKDELAAAGFEAPAVEPYILEFRFEDEQSWWDWSQSHAGRAAFDLLPAETVERYRARAFEEMQVCRADDGTFPRSYSALFATARRP